MYPIEILFALVMHLQQMQPLAPYRPIHAFTPDSAPSYASDFSQVRGQEHVKRALEVAAAGQHNLLMMGPPGAGKTLLARSFPSILPNLTLDEALQVTRIYSVNDLLPTDSPLIRHRPFRAASYHFTCWVGGRRMLAPSWGDFARASWRVIS